MFLKKASAGAGLEPGKTPGLHFPKLTSNIHLQAQFLAKSRMFMFGWRGIKMICINSKKLSGDVGYDICIHVFND